MTTIQELVSAAEGGDGAATRELFSALYQELHTLAEHHLRTSGAVTLGTTTLLHEAYLALSRREGVTFPDRGRFLAYASRAMRGLVVDYVRARRARKRGGEFEITSLGTDPPGAGPADESLEGLAAGVEELGAMDPGLAQLVDLHFFSRPAACTPAGSRPPAPATAGAATPTVPLETDQASRGCPRRPWRAA